MKKRAPKQGVAPPPPQELGAEVKRIAEVPRDPPDQDVISALESLLDLANRGELRFLFAFGVVDEPGSPGTCLKYRAGSYRRCADLLWALEHAKHKLITDARGWEEDR